MLLFVFCLYRPPALAFANCAWRSRQSSIGVAAEPLILFRLGPSLKRTLRQQPGSRRVGVEKQVYFNAAKRLRPSAPWSGTPVGRLPAFDGRIMDMRLKHDNC
jgi:hypothetical protein